MREEHVVAGDSWKCGGRGRGPGGPSTSPRDSRARRRCSRTRVEQPFQGREGDAVASPASEREADEGVVGPRARLVDDGEEAQRVAPGAALCAAPFAATAVA